MADCRISDLIFIIREISLHWSEAVISSFPRKDFKELRWSGFLVYAGTGNALYLHLIQPLLFRSLRSFFQFYKAVRLLQKNIRIQNSFTNRVLNDLLPPLLRENDGTLGQRDLRRMRDYPWQFVALFAEIFADLRSRPLTDLERRKLTLFASSSCLYDDFFDHPTLPDEDVKKCYLNPFGFHPNTTKEKTLAVLLQRMYEYQPLSADFESTFLKFYHSQIESKRQYNNPSLTTEEIRTTSFNKGGYALLLARLLMENALHESEREAIYALGAWFQILDDIVDIEKDRQENIKTVATIATKVQEIEQELDQQTNTMVRLLRRLDYPDEAKEKAIRLIRMIGSSGWIHMQRLKALERKTSGVFMLHAYTSDEIRWVENRLSNYWVGLLYWLKINT